MYHIFIQSSVRGHLGCFHVLAIVNNAAVNIGVQGSFWVMFISGFICPKVGLQGHMVVLFLVFRRTSILFSIVAVPIYALTNSVGRVPSPQTLFSIYCLWILLMMAILAGVR